MSIELNTVVIISDTSIKNNVTISIIYIHFFNNLLKKTSYHVINITSTEAELFTLRCGINQVVQIPDSSCIIVITDALYTAQQIFNLSTHPYQV